MMQADTKQKVLFDFWYASELPDVAVSLDDYAKKCAGPRLAAILLSTRLTRALTMIWFGRRFRLIVPNWYKYGRLICVLQGLLGTRNILLLECIDYNIASKGKIIQAIYLVLARHIFGAGMRRSVVRIQVMTEWERRTFVERFGLFEDMLVTIRWPMLGWDQPNLEPVRAEAGNYVFSSGRVACDWPTLFRAAEIGGWKLVVVCSRKDKSLVDHLNERLGAEVHSEVSVAEHNRILARAAVYALALKECSKSSGQVRLASCIQAEVPVVASRVRGLDGYAVDGENCVMVDEGEPGQLASSVRSLLDNPHVAADLTHRATAQAAGYSKANYFSEIGSLIESAMFAHPR